MDLKQLKLWTALVTPMHSDGSIDFEGMETLVRKQEEAGNGILILGSTGEGLALDAGEKESVAEFVSELNPETGVMAGVGGFNLKDQQEWISRCNELNIDAFLMVSPLYSKPGPAGMEQWFRSLLDHSAKPSMLYNIPGRTGSRITPAVVEKLAGHPMLWGLKEAGGSVDEYRAFRNRLPELPLYSGDDGLLPAFASEGCSGLVSVASNVWPAAVHHYTELCLAGGTSPFDRTWKECVKTLFMVSNPIPSKVLLVEKGWIGSPALRLPLTEDELTDREPLLEADRKIMNWFTNLEN